MDGRRGRRLAARRCAAARGRPPDGPAPSLPPSLPRFPACVCRVRLFGIDAPETKQACTRSQGGQYLCGTGGGLWPLMQGHLLLFTCCLSVCLSCRMAGRQLASRTSHHPAPPPALSTPDQIKRNTQAGETSKEALKAKIGKAAVQCEQARRGDGRPAALPAGPGWLAGAWAALVSPPSPPSPRTPPTPSPPLLCARPCRRRTETCMAASWACARPTRPT